MKLFRYQGRTGPRLGIENGDGRAVDLTAVSADVFGSIGSWLSARDPVAAAVEAAAKAPVLDAPAPALLAPIDTQEVWAAGVTYQRSREARREESPTGGDFYDLVYEADRPELFFKALPHRVSGPGGPIRIRRDSAWNVPEPELALVLSSAGAIVGYTIGNDVSSRSIEGENPLYLPQAKVYEGACAVGPMIAVAVPGGLDPATLPVRLTIQRDGAVGFVGETSTRRMRRRPEELAAWLVRELRFPWGAVLMTGTGIVPGDSFTLRPGDVVEIAIDGIGTLTNTVARDLD